MNRTRTGNSHARQRYATVLKAIALMAALSAQAAAQTITLSKDSSTDYTIVIPADATGVDRYAASELSIYLEQITGAQFPVVGAMKSKPGSPAIFLGLSAPALTRLGDHPTAGFQDQEYVARSLGKDVLLYGKGVHGNLYAAIDFLENSLGWRWFSVYEQPLLPDTPTVSLEPFERRHACSFRTCSMDLQHSMDWPYQMGVNLYFDQRMDRARMDLPRSERAFVSAYHEVEHGAGNHHTIFSFIPPTPDNRFAACFDWQEKKNYFETHPDFYSMNADGTRTPRQLCFGNPELRAEFTRQALRLIKNEGDDITVAIGPIDNPKPLCLCPACKALEEKYQSPGGPLYDYLIEIGRLLEKEYPGVRVFSLAYRRSQTQIPPVLSGGEKLPSNLIIDFCPIEDSHFADWTHPDPSLQGTYRDLQHWSSIVQPGNLFAIFYGPYGAGTLMPFAGIERLITTMRMLHDAGIRGIHLDHASTHNRAAFGELRSYLVCKLRQDITANTDAIIREFTDYMYGPAAEQLRTYMHELEEARKAVIAEGLPKGVFFSSALEPTTYPYLTPENIHRWQGYFDRMTLLTAGEPLRHRTNVRIARRQLDLATLWRWFDIKATYPDGYQDHQLFVDRIAAANNALPTPAPQWEQRREGRPDGFATINRSWNRHPLGEAMARDFSAMIKGGGKAKPLPAELSELDPARVKRFVPSNRANPIRGYSPIGDRIVADTDAAFGFAATTYLPAQQPRQKLPFRFGYRTKRHAPSVSRSIEIGEIRPGFYRIYKLGIVTMTPTGEVWMPEWTCSTQLEIGKRLYEPGADNRWEIHVSLKFDGPTYGGASGKDRVWCDQVIAVKIGEDQFEAPSTEGE